jgi:hypothetical protein
VRRVLGDHIHDRTWIRAVADEVAEECEAFRVVRVCVAKACIERFDVAMNVGEKREKHRPGSMLNVGAPLAIMKGSCPWVQGDKYD